MTRSEKDNLLIEKYISGQLTEDEHQQFDARMSDPLFAEEVAVQDDIKRASQSFERDHLRTLMQQEEQIINPPIRSFASQRYQRILGWSAAAILLLITIFIFLLPFAPGTSNQSLYTNYYEPFPNIISPLTKGVSGDLNGYRAYESAQYDRAIEWFKEQPDLDEPARFYLAQCYLASGDLDDAEDLLEDLSEGDHDLNIPSKWYLALIHLRKGDRSDAFNLLDEVSQTNHPLAKKAQQLLNDIEER